MRILEHFSNCVTFPRCASQEWNSVPIEPGCNRFRATRLEPEFAKNAPHNFNFICWTWHKGYTVGSKVLLLSEKKDLFDPSMRINQLPSKAVHGRTTRLET